MTRKIAKEVDAYRVEWKNLAGVPQERECRAWNDACILIRHCICLGFGSVTITGVGVLSEKLEAQRLARGGV